jgi:hypothetical protein
MPDSLRQNGDDLTTLRLDMHANGYRPVPVSSPECRCKDAGKRPLLTDWPTKCATATADVISEWTEAEGNSTNTGILTGDVAGIDIDVPVPGLVDRLEDLALEMLGETPLWRFGSLPKRLAVYRIDKPFGKLQTPADLVMPDGTPDGIKVQVEILADGQQFVAFGTHPGDGTPESRHPYCWRDKTPHDVPVDELPVIDRDKARQFIAAAEQMLRQAGAEPRKKEEAKPARPFVSQTWPNVIHISEGRAEGRTFFQAVNERALKDIDAWVPQIFPTARKQTTGAWRVSSRDLGRNLEEDLSIHPDGIQDFGSEQAETPINLVIRSGKARDAVTAAHWLCDWLGIAPQDHGWSEPQTTREPPGKEQTTLPPEQQRTGPGDGLLLSIDDWLAAEIDPLDFVMGEVFHTESRAYLVGPTGLGKTNFGMALAAAMAAGTDFLHWKGSGKPRRVLYVDGEMGKRLMVQRIHDVVRRHGSKPAGLFILCRANAGDMPPLNTGEGQHFIEAVIEQVGGIDFIVFDNLQALVTGSLREEDPFAAALPWAKTLTGRSIGQLWVHHTGIDESRGYGDKSKEWQFDTVLLLKRAGEDGEVMFDLEFTKARERTPDNRDDFALTRVALADDRWTVEGVRKADGSIRKNPSPGAATFFIELCNAINIDGAANATSTKARWREECCRRGKMAMEPQKNGTGYTRSSRSLFDGYVRELVQAQWIVVDGEAVRIIKK